MPSPAEWDQRARQLLASAEAGNSVALGELLEFFRAYLSSIAQEEIKGDLQQKVNPSDIVQDTFTEVCRIFSRFQGSQPEELRAWLRGILLNKLRELHRHYFEAGKREVNREQSLDDSSPGTPLRQQVAGPTSTPSGIAVRKEEAELLRAALERLPEPYRNVIVWRNYEDVAFAEIGRRLGRSEDAVRMLYTRALYRLERELRSDHESP